MNTRKLFADTINELDSHSGHMESECERFGMTWGCRPDCPVFERGECELQKENEEKFFSR